MILKKIGLLSFFWNIREKGSSQDTVHLFLTFLGLEKDYLICLKKIAKVKDRSYVRLGNYF